MSTRRLTAASLAAGALVALSGCFHGDQGSSATETDESPPVATTAGFHVRKAGAALPGRSEPRLVARRLVEVLRAFNGGHARDFARAFTSPVSFQPYNDTPLAPESSATSALTREEVARFVTSRHTARDAWVARALQPPLGNAGLPRRAVFGLELQITVNSELLSPRFAKVVVECGSGLIQAWVGPLVEGH